MAQPVWVLSVDLQTKTATFTSGLADAARGARTSFNDIKSSAAEMSRGTRGSIREANESVIAMGDLFGVHMPESISRTLAGLESLGPALEAALPVAAIALGASLIIEHLKKVREEAAKLADDQTNFGTTVNKVFGALDDKLLEAGIKADELNNDHLAALRKQLVLIDHQSLEELAHSFEELDKAADQTFADLKTSWYQMGSGSEGAKHALSEFKSQYDSLLAQGKDKEAADLLAGTRKSAERVLELQKQAADNQTKSGPGNTHQGDYTKFEQASLALKAQGIGYSEKEIAAQQTLVDVLNAQVTVEEKVQALKQKQDSNAGQDTQKAMNTDSDKLAREQAQQWKQAQDDQDKAEDQAYREAVERIQQTEKEKVAATEQGSAARLAAIDAAIQDENSKGLQETSYYQELLQARVNAIKQFNDEESQLKAEAGKIDAEHTQKMGELKVAADKDAAQLRLSAMRVTDQERLEDETQTANEQFKVQQKALEQEIAALNSGDKDYQNKLKELQDRETELVQAHENQLTEIKDKATEERNARILSAQTRADEAIAHSLSASITGHQTWAKSLLSLSGQVASGMLDNAIKAILADDMTKPHDAALAARKMFLAGASMPFPANIIMAPLLAAGAFAEVMAFASGGIVPGVALSDTVPAMLTPGEAVLPKNLTDGLMKASQHGTMGESNAIHVHHHNTFHVQALDSQGVDRVLTEHAGTFAKHFNNHVRRMNR